MPSIAQHEARRSFCQSTMNPPRPRPPPPLASTRAPVFKNFWGGLPALLQATVLAASSVNFFDATSLNATARPVETSWIEPHRISGASGQSSQPRHHRSSSGTVTCDRSIQQAPGAIASTAVGNAWKRCPASPCGPLILRQVKPRKHDTTKTGHQTAPRLRTPASTCVVATPLW